MSEWSCISPPPQNRMPLRSAQGIFTMNLIELPGSHWETKTSFRIFGLLARLESVTSWRDPEVLAVPPRQSVTQYQNIMIVNKKFQDANSNNQPYCFVECDTAWFVQLFATDWKARGSYTGTGEIIHTRPAWLWVPPSLLYNGYWVFHAGVNQRARGVFHPLPSSAEIRGRIELYLYSPSGPSWGEIYLYFYFYLWFVKGRIKVRASRRAARSATL